MPKPKTFRTGETKYGRRYVYPISAKKKPKKTRQATLGRPMKVVKTDLIPRTIKSSKTVVPSRKIKSDADKIPPFIEGKPVRQVSKEEGRRLSREWVEEEREARFKRQQDILKERYYADIGKTVDRITTRNRRIITMLKLEGRMSSREIANRLGLKESTIKTELKYLEKKGFVKEV